MYLSIAILIKIANSPFGRVLQALRENEERTAFLGFSRNKYKFYSMIISGGFTSVAGALYVPVTNIGSSHRVSR